MRLRLIKLVPTDWGPPTFEIDGIKMLPTSRVSPFADAERKVGLIEPRGKTILDTCGGLGYFAAWCLQGMADESFLLREESRCAVAAQLESLVARRGRTPSGADPR
jgi:predicted methyltransferase